MEIIYDFTGPYSFNTLELGVPVNKNGIHLMKFANKNNPVYIQPPKCSIKHGFFKSGKKMYCDLLFSIEDTQFFEWLEELEQKSIETIYANRTKWFDTELDESDIENTMTSPYKMYKAGKLFIVRTGVSVNLGKIDLKIYDEDENELQHEDLKDGTQVMVILEFKGIKCSARSFQFEIEMKQMLVSKPVQLFQQCLLKKKSGIPSVNTEIAPSLPTLANIDPPSILEKSSLDNTEEEKEEETIETLDITNSYGPELVSIDTHEIQNQLPEMMEEAAYEVEELPTNTTIPDGPIELDLEIEDVDAEESEPLQLKNRKDVYYKMYKDARQKAREAKIVALTNYLEAKRIKNTYFLDEMSDEDSDLDELIKVNEER